MTKKVIGCHPLSQNLQMWNLLVALTIIHIIVLRFSKISFSSFLFCSSSRSLSSSCSPTVLSTGFVSLLLAIYCHVFSLFFFLFIVCISRFIEHILVLHNVIIKIVSQTVVYRCRFCFCLYCFWYVMILLFKS